MHKNLIFLILIIIVLLICGVAFFNIILKLQSAKPAQEKEYAESILSNMLSLLETEKPLIESSLTAAKYEIYRLEEYPNSIKKYLTEIPIVRQFIFRKQEKTLFISADNLNQTEQQCDNLFQKKATEIYQDATSTDQGFISLECPDKSSIILYWIIDIAIERIPEYRMKKTLMAFELNTKLLETQLIKHFTEMTNVFDQGFSDPTYGLFYANMYITLENQQKVLLHEWGKRNAKNIAKNKAFIDLNPPLQDYRLSYYGDNLIRGIHPIYKYGLVLAMMLILLALISLAIFLYRKQIHKQRLADRRLSFTNQVSHELKTPLTNIKLYTELLKENIKQEMVATIDENAEFTDVIASETDRLNRLINNVLSFAKNKNNKLQLNVKSGSVDDLINKIISIFSPLLALKNVKINFEGNANKTVKFDHDVIEQILNNLFSNVEKYGHQGRKLNISSMQNANLTTIQVRDFGPGIPKKAQKKIFREFYRVSSKLSDGVTGTGLGLNIAKQLAQLHGGDLQLIPTDMGACFQLTFNVE